MSSAAPPDRPDGPAGGPSEPDARLAARLADQAGSLLLGVRAEHFDQPKQRGAAGDSRSNQFLLAELTAARPSDSVLSEEAVDDKRRLRAERVWIVDPLDGTREFSLGGRPDWAVHVALWERDRGITAAAVAQPDLGCVYASDDPVPSLVAPPRDRPLILVSDSRPPAVAVAAAERIGADVAPMGSAGAKAMAVLRGDADAYVHAGGQWEWDSAAPVGVVLAAGFYAARLDGSPLLYNAEHPYLPDLVICRADLAPSLMEAIAAVSA